MKIAVAIVIFVVILSAQAASTAFAAEEIYNYQQEKENNLKIVLESSFRGSKISESNPIIESSLGFFGCVAGFIAHESGHQGEASLRGITLKWNFETRSWRYKIDNRFSESDVRSVAYSGLMMQVFTTEFIINTPGIEKGPFVVGWLFFNIVNSIRYTTIENKKPGIPNDFNVVRGNKGNPDAFKTAVLVHSIFSAYRVLYDIPPIFDVEPVPGGAIITAAVFHW